jgi:hypothetical protein
MTAMMRDCTSAVPGGALHKGSACRVQPFRQDQRIAAQGSVSAVRPDGRGSLLRFQLGRLLDEILADRDLDPDVRLSLLEQVRGNPASPEVALLRHLRAIHDPEDLPPLGSVEIAGPGASGKVTGECAATMPSGLVT